MSSSPPPGHSPDAAGHFVISPGKTSLAATASAARVQVINWRSVASTLRQSASYITSLELSIVTPTVSGRYGAWPGGVDEGAWIVTGHCDAKGGGGPVSLRGNQPVGQSVSQLVDRLAGQMVGWSMGPPVGWAINKRWEEQADRLVKKARTWMWPGQLLP